MKTYSVHICRTSYAHRTIEVVASSPLEAENKALGEAGNYDYSEKDADYTAESVTEINPEE